MNKNERLTHFVSTLVVKGQKPVRKEEMADLQNDKKDYLFSIVQVGVKQIRYPIWIESDVPPFTQQTTGEFTLSTSLYRHQKI